MQAARYQTSQQFINVDKRVVLFTPIIQSYLFADVYAALLNSDGTGPYSE